jgi:CheY-like chemotaxis protein
MNAVMGMSELALREDMSEAAREHNLTIQQAGTNLLAIINDILDFSKIESGQLEILPEAYQFSSLIGDVASIIKTRVLETRLRFLINISSDLPDALFGDAGRLRQIMLNLLSNAVKYTDTGHVALTVSGEAIDDESLNLIIKVEDTGRGIKEEDIARLFDDFTQFDMERNRGIEGTGLGLAIARGLLQAMGGAIEAESEYGKGSVFTVTVPQIIRSHEPVARVIDPAGKSVLVFERRETYIDSIVKTMADLGVDCHLVTTASGFYNGLNSGRYSFVFVAAALYDKVKKLYDKLESPAAIALIAEFGETVTEKNVSVITTPIYSIPVAAMFNGTAERTAGGGRKPSSIGFTAPAAHILIVDDIQTNLRVAEGLLQPYRMRVDLCNSGMEAIELAGVKRYDLIFMDQMMPFMSGIETTQKIRDMGEGNPFLKDIPIVALTANAVLGTQEMVLEKGFDDYLTKPIDTMKLDALLGKWIPEGKQIRDSGGADAPPPPRSGGTDALPGVDVKYGADMTGGPDNFTRALSVFHEEGYDIIREIKCCLASGDLALYAIHTHALKSAMGSIGALALSEEAALLEEAAKAGGRDAVEARNAGFLEGLETLLGHIGAYVQRYESDAGGGGRPSLEATLARMKDALLDYDIQGINEASAALQEHARDSEFGNQIGRVLRRKLAGEYEDAAALIDEIMAGIGR